MVPERTVRARPFDDAPSHLRRPLGGSVQEHCIGALWSIRRSCPRSATSDGWCGCLTQPLCWQTRVFRMHFGLQGGPSNMRAGLYMGPDGRLAGTFQV